jgi:hypothetical protein
MKKTNFFYGALAVCILAAAAFGAASCSNPVADDGGGAADPCVYACKHSRRNGNQ